MKKPKPLLSQWLAARYNVSVKDFEQSNYPRLWRKFEDINGMAVKGKIVYVKHLNDISEFRFAKLMIHEIEHIKQQRVAGWIPFLWAYAFSQTFRRRMEVTAYTRTMEYHYIIGSDISDYPKHLSSVLRKNYLLSKSQTERARKSLEENVKKIKSGDIRAVRKSMEKWDAV